VIEKSALSVKFTYYVVRCLNLANLSDFLAKHVFVAFFAPVVSEMLD
jgi:hypothetical protein